MQRLAYFIGPNGNVVTAADLPSPKTTRWVIRRKAEVVLAVRGGLLDLDEACTRYHLTVQEFYSWQSAMEKRGLLKVANHVGHSTWAGSQGTLNHSPHDRSGAR